MRIITENWIKYNTCTFIKQSKFGVWVKIANKKDTYLNTYSKKSNLMLTFEIPFVLQIIKVLYLIKGNGTDSFLLTNIRLIDSFIPNLLSRILNYKINKT